MKDKQPWFAHKEFDNLTIILFHSISDHRVVKSKLITALVEIEDLTARIEQIPTDGDMMISFGPDASYMQLVFEGTRGKQVIEVIQQRIKTPSTGFHSRNLQEQELYQKLVHLLDQSPE